jgi:hypothetical protein
MKPGLMGVRILGCCSGWNRVNPIYMACHRCSVPLQCIAAYLYDEKAIYNIYVCMYVCRERGVDGAWYCALRWSSWSSVGLGGVGKCSSTIYHPPLWRRNFAGYTGNGKPVGLRQHALLPIWPLLCRAEELSTPPYLDDGTRCLVDKWREEGRVFRHT